MNTTEIEKLSPLSFLCTSEGEKAGVTGVVGVDMSISNA